MTNLVTGLVSWFQSRNDFASFMGSYVSGNTTQYGPFLNLAPEAVATSGPIHPYTTLQTFGRPMDQGFINVGRSTPYVEKPLIRIQLWDLRNLRCMQNIEKVIAALDSRPSIPLTAPDIILSIVREENAQSIPQPIGRSGARVYMWVIDYEFRVQRTVGS